MGGICMKFKLLTCTVLFSICCSAIVLAESPIPSFDKAAVTEYPYNRRGNQEIIVDNSWKYYHPGNTGTEESPAFYIKKIRLTGFVLPQDHQGTTLQSILDRYTGRNVEFNELRQLTEVITAYARDCGYTVSQAVVPQQEISDGQLEIKVYAAVYDSINMVGNTSRVADRVLLKYLKPLKKDTVITDKKLERVLNSLNDLPGVTARGTLYPGLRPVSTGLVIDIIERPVWNNYIFADNGGSRSSGRYRYGIHTEINNPGQQGDKIELTGFISNRDTDNYAFSYETAVGSRGTRMGVGLSKTTYDIGWQDNFLHQYGESEAVSVYGLTPVYRDKSKRLTALYGYDHRSIRDDMELRYDLGFGGIIIADRLKNKKYADVMHIGITGSEYLPGQFTYGNITYWYGDIDVKDDSAYFEGFYHKLTADVKHVRYWTDWNLRLEAHGQLANRDLDGSERFYLGGLNGVRAYPASEISGDTGYNATLELRRHMGIDGLEAAAFIDVGEVKLLKSSTRHKKLAGWGLGVRYARENDWYAQLDYAWKIDGEPYQSEGHDHDGRLWFQIYKMF